MAFPPNYAYDTLTDQEKSYVDNLYDRNEAGRQTAREYVGQRWDYIQAQQARDEAAEREYQRGVTQESEPADIPPSPDGEDVQEPAEGGFQ